MMVLTTLFVPGFIWPLVSSLICFSPAIDAVPALADEDFLAVVLHAVRAF
jgi:hypothetical protein